MVTYSVLAGRVLANAAAVATAIAGGTTTAEAQALADLLLVLSKRNDLGLPPLLLSSVAKTGLNLG